jgi:hypothetical protein
VAGFIEDKMEKPICKHCQENKSLTYVEGIGFLCQDHYIDWEWEQVVIPPLPRESSYKFGGRRDRSLW